MNLAHLCRLAHDSQHRQHLDLRICHSNSGQSWSHARSRAPGNSQSVPRCHGSYTMQYVVEELQLNCCPSLRFKRSFIAHHSPCYNKHSSFVDHVPPCALTGVFPAVDGHHLDCRCRSCRCAEPTCKKHCSGCVRLCTAWAVCAYVCAFVFDVCVRAQEYASSPVRNFLKHTKIPKSLPNQWLKSMLCSFQSKPCQ